MAGQRIDVFISSTSIDLPEHRQAVISALLGMGLFPSGMEHWPAADENPVDFCRQKLEEAEVYIGIYAHRYGWRPKGDGTKSITELEYEWATERKMPRFCFIIDSKYPWSPELMELDAKADLDAFKARVKQQVVGFFTTPDNLKAQVSLALAKYAQKQDISVTEPYLRRLHYEAMQSGLLRSLDPRSKDPAFRDRTATVDQVYTPLDTRERVRKDDGGQIIWERPEDLLAKSREEGGETFPLSAMEAANHYPHLVILGDPGSGKSTFVNFLALSLSGHWLNMAGDWLANLQAQGWEQEALLPLHVTLRDFAQQIPPHETVGTAQHLLDHLAGLLEKCGCGEAMGAVKGALGEGRALLILDGLDEIPAEKRELVREAVQMLLQAYKHCRVIITCRILSYANPAWQIPQTETVTLAPFDEEKIRHFIGAWYTASQNMGATDPITAQARIADLSRAVGDPWLRELATNPMLLTVMAIVHNHRGTLPRETARLYEACVEILMYKWKPDEARHLKEELGLTDENDLYRILWQIAYEAHAKAADRAGAADISKAEVMAIVAEDHLGGSYAKAEIFCEYVEKRAGLLIGRGEGGRRERVYAFPHRTFQEYLAGCYLADGMDFADEIDRFAHEGANWRQVVLLAIGQMYFNKSDRNQPLLAVQYMLREEPQSEADWQAVALAGQMLLIIGLAALEKHRLGVDLLNQARARLADLVGSGYLEPVERAEAGRTLAELGDPRKGVGVLRLKGEDVLIPDIDWVEIPAGEFQYGHEDQSDNPPQVLNLETYWISRYPLTYHQFQTFVDDPEGYSNPYWFEGLAADESDRRLREQTFQYSNHPRESVNWYQAMAFCRWFSWRLSALTPNLSPSGRGAYDPMNPFTWLVRLPTEQEWEKAARGTDGRIYPYGNEFDAMKGNTDPTGLGQTSAVGMFPQGASPYGVLDMSGNVWEWCLTEYRSKRDDDLFNSNSRVLRGGSFVGIMSIAASASRNFVNPYGSSFNLGVRLLCASPISMIAP